MVFKHKLIFLKIDPVGHHRHKAHLVVCDGFLFVVVPVLDEDILPVGYVLQVKSPLMVETLPVQTECYPAVEPEIIGEPLII